MVVSLKKGELTKQKIIEIAAPIFNKKGFEGTTLDDIIESSGLKKGGIYRHFSSKEDIAKACFCYSYGHLSKRFFDACSNHISAKDKLNAFLDEFLEIYKNPPISGGCPILNASIEFDDTNEEFRTIIIDAVNKWHKFIENIINQGILDKEFNQNSSAEVLSTIFIASLEGAVFLCKLYNDLSYIIKVVCFLKIQIKAMLIQGEQPI